MHDERTHLDRLVDFVYGQLHLWRDDPRRQPEDSEIRLSAQLCSHLNSACGLTEGFDTLQFKQEEPDVRRGRTVDLAILPRSVEIVFAGRRHTHFDPLVRAECKRLPIPKPREKREYLHTSRSTTGGILRFKQGHHGSDHDLSIMIAYIQSGTVASWNAVLLRWIRALARARVPLWSTRDLIRVKRHDRKLRKAALVSSHERASPLRAISIHHLWIEMPGADANRGRRPARRRAPSS